MLACIACGTEPKLGAPEFLGPQKTLNQRPTNGGRGLSDKTWPVTASARQLNGNGCPVTAGSPVACMFLNKKKGQAGGCGHP